MIVGYNVHGYMSSCVVDVTTFGGYQDYGNPLWDDVALHYEDILPWGMVIDLREGVS